jgi:PAS domain S-box-containing protein
VDHLVLIIQDITERKRAEEARRYLSEIIERSLNEIYVFDSETLKFKHVNQGALTNLQYTLDEIRELTPLDLKPEFTEELFRAMIQPLLAREQEVHVFQTVHRRADASLYPVEVHLQLVDIGTERVFLAVIYDITTRKQLEAENERLAAQFYQAQKMESIGRLAGGIAHDFNNLLVPIIGYAELGLLKLDLDSQLHADLKRIKEAGQRAASLTRQILAFSRQQVLEMKRLDLNQVISEFEPMLHRLIGEDIALQTHLAANPSLIKADKGQLEQVLLNLAVNARDAMPDGGMLIIETAPVTLDEAYMTKDTDVLQPGRYVLLAVSDTGHGIDADAQQHIFEPFFTTKAPGQGTGLGLATVFGIVKQHAGNIWVYSEPGRGTTFKIYLPLAQAPVSIVESESPEADSLDGTETVLLVEDEASVRQLVGDTLRAHGYQVLATGDPAKGLELAATHQGAIHLLLTDVIMPVMNGRELYRRLVRERSGLKILYMSGYTDNVIAHHQVLDEEIAFLQKPFTIRSLLQKVRAVLG